jgi:activator of HSP90 ATPase
MKSFKKYFTIPAEPQEVFAALTFKPTIELWTGSPAEFEKKPDTEFSMWDESIVGRNIEFEEGKKIVQEWFFGQTDNPSIVTIKLHDDKKGTSMEVSHTNIPDEAFEDIVDGWVNVYAKDLIEFYRE